MSGVAQRVNKALARIAPPLDLSRLKIAQHLDRLVFTWKVRSALYRHMATQIENEISQIKALEKFQKQLVRRKKMSCVAVLNDVIRRMKDGALLSSALQKWVPVDEALTISGGEAAGQIEAAFTLLVDSKTRIAKVRRSAKKALRTPLIYSAATFLMLWGTGRFVMPSIAQATPASSVHGLASLLFALTAAANNILMVLPALMIGAGYGWLVWAMPNWTGRYRTFFEQYYPFNFYRDVHGYVWLMTFSSMLAAGMSDTRILNDQTRLASPWLRQRLMVLRRKMVNGEALSSALLSSGFEFPNPDLIDDIESMADFDDFPFRIRARAQDWATELESTVEDRVASLAFWFEIVMYGLMGVIAVGIISLTMQIGHVPMF